MHILIQISHKTTKWCAFSFLKPSSWGDAKKSVLGQLLSERPCIIMACKLVHNELGLNLSVVNIANLLYYTYNTCNNNKIYMKTLCQARDTESECLK